MASGSKGSRLWSAYGFAATMVGGLAARKAMTTSWKVATGKKPPQNPAHPDVSIGEAVAWAAFTGVGVGLARMLAARKAASYWRKSTGHLPPNLDEVEV